MNPDLYYKHTTKNQINNTQSNLTNNITYVNIDLNRQNNIANKINILNQHSIDNNINNIQKTTQ